MKKTNLLLVCLVVLLSSVVFWACQKEQQQVQPEIQTAKSNSSTNSITSRSGSTDEIREVRRVFGKALARSLDNANFRAFIHEKMLLGFNSDYELLYIAEKNTAIPNMNATLAEVLASNSNHDLEYFNNIPDTDPYLTISMPEAELWDVRNWSAEFVPEVAMLVGQESECVMFNKNETQHQQDSKEDPALPVISIWNAETVYFVNNAGITVDGIPINELMPTTPSSNANAYNGLQNPSNMFNIAGEEFYKLKHNDLIAAYTAGNTVVSVSMPPNPCECIRDCVVADEILRRFKINGWGVYVNIKNQFNEKYFVFHGDFLGAVKDGVVAPTQSKFVSTAYRKWDIMTCNNGPCQGKWLTADYRLWNDWDQAILGSPYLIDWAEVDNGTTTTDLNVSLTSQFKIAGLTTPGATVNAGISRVGDKTVLLGNQRVFYCDKNLMDNNTGSITFNCGN